jgi:hypothetical protein
MKLKELKRMIIKVTTEIKEDMYKQLNDKMNKQLN